MGDGSNDGAVAQEHENLIASLADGALEARLAAIRALGESGGESTLLALRERQAAVNDEVIALIAAAGMINSKLKVYEAHGVAAPDRVEEEPADKQVAEGEPEETQEWVQEWTQEPEHADAPVQEVQDTPPQPEQGDQEISEQAQVISDAVDQSQEQQP